MSYRQLLTRSPIHFFALSLAARFPYAMTPLATLLATRAATGSLTFAGLVTAGQSLGLAGAGPALGALADRLGARRVGRTAATVCALATIGLLASTQVGPDARAGMLAGSILIGLSQPSVGILVRAHWAVSLDRSGHAELLPSALAWESVADETSFVAGPVLVGALSMQRAAGALALIAALLLFAAVPLAGQYAQTHDAGDAGESRPAAARPGLPRVRIAALALGMAAIGTVFGAVQTGITRYAGDTGHPGNAAWLYALLGIGSAAAGVGYAWLPARITGPTRYLLAALALVAGCTLLGLAIAGRFAVPVAMLVAGLAVAPYLIALFSTAEQITPRQRLTTGIAIVAAGGAVGSALGQLVGARLAQRAAADAIALAIAASVVGLLTALGLVRSAARPCSAGLRRDPRATDAPPSRSRRTRWRAPRRGRARSA
jgi:predicted MFS family arabinose efflux permease